MTAPLMYEPTDPADLPLIAVDTDTWAGGIG